ncbi:alpha-(1,3)-fucosyltransferase C [Helicoverpa armigera]|uniref:alpha-(1,3)-fucosyltransferase C n=1 Tax=Helicoverpa armigera TaxID=29058 RepID=UPI0030835F3A
MRSLCSKKAIFFIAVMIIILLLYSTAKTLTNSHRIISDGYKLISDQIINTNSEVIKKGESENSVKYILQWTNPKNVPFVYMGEGRSGFTVRNCPYTNCIVTADRSLLGNYTNFDVIAFAGPEVVDYRSPKLPTMRSPHQKYAFASIESSDNYPVCSDRLNNFFNWTWTFKLDSEIRWGYLTVRDKNNVIVGPNKVMHWMKLQDMDPVSDDFKEQLKTKTKAAAWFVSNCNSKSRREAVARDLKKELQSYKMDLDMYGSCGNLKCSRDKEDECNTLIKTTYYFYLSFENSFSEDYVTEKLLRALNNDAVPIVYGAANYTRFMPDGIYLNARELSVKELAAKMHELMNDPEKYSEYFKWKNHYSYHRKDASVDTDPYCLFCTHLNNEEMVKKTTIYENFRQWWNPPGRC